MRNLFLNLFTYIRSLISMDLRRLEFGLRNKNFAREPIKSLDCLCSGFSKISSPHYIRDYLPNSPQRCGRWFIYEIIVLLRIRWTFTLVSKISNCAVCSLWIFVIRFGHGLILKGRVVKSLAEFFESGLLLDARNVLQWDNKPRIDSCWSSQRFCGLMFWLWGTTYKYATLRSKVVCSIHMVMPAKAFILWILQYTWSFC